MLRRSVALLTLVAAGAVVAVMLGGGTARVAPPATATAAAPTTVDPPALAALERRFAARVGVYAVDTGSGRAVAHRADERFAFASTGKILSAGVVLERASEAQLDRVVRWRRRDLLDYAPITDDFTDSGLALRHLLDAELVWSDNTAANVVVRELGGPAALQRALPGALGDRVTHVDRTEPRLNTAIPGDVRDTTTPRQMATNLRRLLLGTLLTPHRRSLMRALLRTTTTGDALIRAAVPSSWTVADKTGTGDYGTRNDVALVERPRGDPIVIAVYTTHDRSSAAADDALVAAAARAAITSLR